MAILTKAEAAQQAIEKEIAGFEKEINDILLSPDNVAYMENDEFESHFFIHSIKNAGKVTIPAIAALKASIEEGGWKSVTVKQSGNNLYVEFYDTEQSEPETPVTPIVPDEPLEPGDT